MQLLWQKYNHWNCVIFSYKFWIINYKLCITHHHLKCINTLTTPNHNCAITLLMPLFLYTLLSRNPSNNFVIDFLIYKIGSEHVTTFWICRCGLVTRMRSYLTRPDFDAFTECDAVLGKKVSLQRLNGKLQSIIRRSYSDINS